MIDTDTIAYRINKAVKKAGKWNISIETNLDPRRVGLSVLSTFLNAKSFTEHSDRTNWKMQTFKNGYAYKMHMLDHVFLYINFFDNLKTNSVDIIATFATNNEEEFKNVVFYESLNHPKSLWKLKKFSKYARKHYAPTFSKTHFMMRKHSYEFFNHKEMR